MLQYVQLNYVIPCLIFVGSNYIPQCIIENFINICCQHCLRNDGRVVSIQLAWTCSIKVKNAKWTNKIDVDEIGRKIGKLNEISVEIG